MPKQRSATRESAQARLEKRASLPRGVRKTKQPASSTNPGSPDPYVTPASIGADRAASAFGIQTPGQPDLDLDFNVDAPAQHPHSAKLLSLRNQARNEAHKLLQGTWVPGTCAGCGAALDWEVKARVCVLCKAVKHINLQASPTVTDTNDPSSLDTSVHAPPEAINTEAIWGQYAFPGTIDETTGDIDHPLARDAVLEAEGTFIGSPRPPAAHHSEQESAFDEFMSVEQQAFLADFINAPGAAVSTILTDGVEDVDALPSFPFPDTGDDCPTQEDWDWLNSDGL
ncbi:MAG: hypothetical protein M1832_003127 [Thelocarpon impressellum]|nr:MAG: hypothetical protein M1832_003127 [Thelocarpon impressellum]